MWYNGFLQNLDIDLARRDFGGFGRTAFARWLRRVSPFHTPVVTRLVARRTGSWFLETDSGECHDVRLVSGWILGGGICFGLYWKSDEGRRFRCWLAGWQHDPVVLRRLRVRLKVPV